MAVKIDGWFLVDCQFSARRVFPDRRDRIENVEMEIVIAVTDTDGYVVRARCWMPMWMAAEIETQSPAAGVVRLKSCFSQLTGQADICAVDLRYMGHWLSEYRREGREALVSAPAPAPKKA